MTVSIVLFYKKYPNFEFLSEHRIELFGILRRSFFVTCFHIIKSLLFKFEFPY